MTRLYVSDLDHTLLQQDGELSAVARIRLSKMLREGLPFTVASARSIVSIREILRDLPLSLPVVHYNGGFVSDWTTGKHWFIEAMDRELAAEVIAEIENAGALAMISTHNGTDSWIFHGGPGNAGMQWYLDSRREVRDDRPRQIAKLAEALGEPVVAITAIDAEARLAPLFRKLGESLDGRVQLHFYENQYDKPWHWLSIYPARATKAAALERLIRELKIEPENLVVFGDGDNDLPMFKLAGRGVAVENATDALKAVADEIIGPNTADSVIDYLEREWEALRGAMLKTNAKGPGHES